MTAFGFCENIAIEKNENQIASQSQSSKIPSQVLFTFFNNWPNLATITYKIEIVGTTSITVGTGTKIVPTRTEMIVKQWVKKVNDPNWVFEVFWAVLENSVTVNGEKVNLN